MEFEGEVAAFLVRHIPAAVWSPGELTKVPDLNPFRAARPESEAMRRHKESWKRRKFRVLSGG